jgi:CrcB protein
MNFLIVFLGGGLGAALRHAVNVLFTPVGGASFPYATMGINVVGSFLMGAIVGFFALQGHASQHWRLFLTTGILGGFTTFSAFSLEAVLLYERGQLLSAALYVSLSVAFAILGLVAGLFLMRAMF